MDAQPVRNGLLRISPRHSHPLIGATSHSKDCGRPRPAGPSDVEASTPWEDAREILRSDRGPATLDAYRFVFTSQYVPRNQALADYAAPSMTPGRPVLSGPAGTVCQ